MRTLIVGTLKMFSAGLMAALVTVPLGCCPTANLAPVVEPAGPIADPQPHFPPEPVAPETIEAQDDVVPGQELPETGKRHEISPLSKELRVGVGDIITHTFEQHGSVGKDADAAAADPMVVAFLRRDTIYKHPDRMGAGLAGGDAASATFVFKALKTGATRLTIQHTFRGKVEQTIAVQVIVE